MLLQKYFSSDKFRHRKVEKKISNLIAKIMKVVIHLVTFIKKNTWAG